MVAEQNRTVRAVVENVLCRRSNPATLGYALLQVVGFALLTLYPARVPAQTGATDTSTTTLVIGFTGGFVRSDDLRHSEAQLAQRLAQNYGDRIEVEMLENRQQERAHKLIIDWLGRLEEAGLTGEEELPKPRIILFGHSWGASTVVYLARELERDGIPVALTVQVDSVKKHGEDDSVIPSNVIEAANFYQPNGILHGEREITAADPARTTILGNYRFSYRHEPAVCHAYPWYDRVMFKGHTAIECDPQVWSQVETLIEARLPQTRPAHTVLAEQVASYRTR